MLGKNVHDMFVAQKWSEVNVICSLNVIQSAEIGSMSQEQCFNHDQSLHFRQIMLFVSSPALL